MKTSLLLFLLLPLVVAAQNRTVVKGRVVAGTGGVKNIFIVNSTTFAEAQTDSLGYFNVKAAKGDLLILTDKAVKPLQIYYTPDTLQDNIFIINAELNATELQEVIINKDKTVSAEGLGLIPKGQAVYTTAERRFESQGKVKVFTDTMNSNLNATIQTDALINRLTGKRKALQQGLETERKQGIVNNLNALYTEDEITKEYKIPKEYISGFIFYVAEDDGIGNCIKFKNNLGLKDRLYQLSLLYLDTLNNEK